MYQPFIHQLLGYTHFPGADGLTPGYDVNALPEAAPFGEASSTAL